MKKFRGITWNHTRGYVPMTATAQRFEELHPEVRIDWDKRSLQAFADEPIDQLAQRYDFLVIDHPWAGFAAMNDVIVALDDYLPAEFLKDQSSNAVGPSHQSYNFNGKQWALAIDAATPVASAREDLLEKFGFRIPATWEDLLTLAEASLVAIPSIPQDTLMNFYMLCSTLGENVCTSEKEVVSKAVGIKSLRMLRELSIHLDKRCFDWNPIQVYEAMTQSDDFAYCPFAYGYSNYSQSGYARETLLFKDMVTIDGSPLVTTLGGTGLAVSRSCKDIETAAKYLEFVGGSMTQKGIFFKNGGQPGHKAAWLDKDVNSLSNNYFLNTLPALQRAFLRPRYFGHMEFQDNAGSPIRSYLMNGGNEEELLEELNTLYIASLEKTLCHSR